MSVKPGAVSEATQISVRDPAEVLFQNTEDLTRGAL